MCGKMPNIEVAQLSRACLDENKLSYWYFISKYWGFLISYRKS